MKSLAFTRSTLRQRLIALAVGIAIAGIAAITFEWPSTEKSRNDATPKPVVAEGPAGQPLPVATQPLSGNDSSVNAGNRHLVLTGTLVAAEPVDSLAFIGVDPRNPQTYAVNSTLVNGTRIQAIARDHVLLEREGRVARLEIGGAWQEAPPAVLRLTAISPPADAALEQPEPAQQALTDGLAISPVFDASGMLTSYRLGPGRNKRVFARWGLEPGDQLVAIESTPLTDVDTASQMLELVGRGEALRATVLRKGTRIAVVLDGRAIAEERARAKATAQNLVSMPSG